MINLKVGQPVHVGWNAAKCFNGDIIAYENVRVEAVGYDWLVVRDNRGIPYTAAFLDQSEVDEFMREITEPQDDDD